MFQEHGRPGQEIPPAARDHRALLRIHAVDHVDQVHVRVAAALLTVAERALHPVLLLVVADRHRLVQMVADLAQRPVPGALRLQQRPLIGDDARIDQHPDLLDLHNGQRSQLVDGQIDERGQQVGGHLGVRIARRLLGLQFVADHFAAGVLQLVPVVGAMATGAPLGVLRDHRVDQLHVLEAQLLVAHDVGRIVALLAAEQVQIEHHGSLLRFVCAGRKED